MRKSPLPLGLLPESVIRHTHVELADAPGRCDGELLNLNMKRILHRFFELGILIKGVDGGLELVGGLLLVFLSPVAINRVLLFL
jgi:hypothetical protein